MGPNTDENQTPANRLAASVPNDLVFKLKDQPKTVPLVLTKWLDRRIKTPYGSDNIHLEKKMDKHTKNHLWRVLQELQESAGVVSVSSQKNVQDETPKADADKMQARTDGNNSCRPQQPLQEPGAENAQTGSGSHLNGTSPSEQFAGVASVSSDTSEKALTGLNISAWKLSSLVLLRAHP